MLDITRAIRAEDTSTTRGGGLVISSTPAPRLVLGCLPGDLRYGPYGSGCILYALACSHEASRSW